MAAGRIRWRHRIALSPWIDRGNPQKSRDDPARAEYLVHEIGKAEPLPYTAADVPRQPAATIKILATLAALEELSPAWQWKTEAYVYGPILNGRLEGDIFNKGFGDPLPVIEDFWAFLRMLRAEGLTSASGDLVLDQGYFSREPGPGCRAKNPSPRAPWGSCCLPPGSDPSCRSPYHRSPSSLCGTLRKRFNNTSFEGRVHLKTGACVM